MKLSPRSLSLLCACAVHTLSPSLASAQSPELKPTAVAAFKNGLAFVVKQGDVHLEAGEATLDPVPAATLGSLWIAPNDPGASLDQVVARRTKHPVLQDLTSLTEVLLANAGKVVTVVENNQEYTGEIVGFRKAEKPAPPAEPVASNSDNPSPQPEPEFLLLKSESKLLALYFRNITRVSLPKDSVLQRAQDVEHKSVQFRIKGATNHANLTMGYLEHGLGWTPSYLISLQDDKKAQITMQAVLVNDAEDLKNTDLFFVVGVPNFAYANVPSPMALQQNLLEFMQAAGRRDNLEYRYSNAITSQVVGGFVAGEPSSAQNFASGTEEMQGSPEEDLFLYTRKDVTLAQGERATYNVFSDTVSYEHIYQWDLTDQPRVDAFGVPQNAPSAEDQSKKQNIWHSLRLKNTTKFPWTSAPTLVISGARPVAQDTLPYTPRTATSNLKLTIATDLRASHDENEVERQRDIQRRSGYNYDQVTVEGKLTVKNYKSREVRLSITQRVRGTVESQTDDGKSERLAEAITADNPLSRLTWELTLQPGEEKIIKYRYKVWLRV
jgi:hypothetical protein